MPDYILASEVELLRSAGFTAGWSGESWFKAVGDSWWQAYQIGDDPYMTFVCDTDRCSQFLTREEFKEKFGG